MGLFVFSLSCVVRLANPGTRAKQNVPFGSGFSGPWWIYWAGSLHENRYSGLLLSNTNLIPRPRLLSAIPMPSPIPELKDISTGKQKCGYFNALYLPWARFKLFDFLACGIGVLACFPKKKKNLLVGSLHVSSEPANIRERKKGRGKGMLLPLSPLTDSATLQVLWQPLTSHAGEGASLASLGVLLGSLISSLSTSSQQVPSALPLKTPICLLWGLTQSSHHHPTPPARPISDPAPSLCCLSLH